VATLIEPVGKCLGAVLRVRRQFFFVIVGVVGLMAGHVSAEPLKIMPLGDSITSGYTGSSWSGTNKFTFGYRGPLYTKLTDAGYDFQFVGASTEPWTTPRIYQDEAWHTGPSAPSAANISGPDLRNVNGVNQDGHRGYWGQRTDWITSNIVSWLNTDNPDIVLLMLGTNDPVLAPGADSAEPVDAETQLNSLVQTIVDTKPLAKVIVAQLAPNTKARYVVPITDSSFVKYNNYIKNTLVPYFQGQGNLVTTVDVFSKFAPGGVVDLTLYADSVHPNMSGYEKIAQTWFDGIQAVVPEPGSLSLLGVFGILFVGRACWRIRRRRG
jgi:lysophospholipase L1-like esterase